MTVVAVIIPFFQRQPGILRRAINSIMAQSLPAGVTVDIIVTDDQSPVSATNETDGLAIAAPFSLKIISQPNGGVSAARNAALRAVSDDTDYIAFLDSDDIWQQGHLALALKAMESGADFYFCDNIRPGHHESQFNTHTRLILPCIARHNADAELIEIDSAEAFSIILFDFPGQASTTLYRRAIAPDLAFDAALKVSGEDMLFYLHVCRAARRVAFCPRAMVECGQGINMYFDSMGWDTAGHFKQVVGRLRSHILIREQFTLSRTDARFNDRVVGQMRRKVAFLIFRHLTRHKGSLRADMRAYLNEEPRLLRWFLPALAQVIVGKPLKLYRPT